jgi:hypothetical protein
LAFEVGLKAEEGVEVEVGGAALEETGLGADRFRFFPRMWTGVRVIIVRDDLQAAAWCRCRCGLRCGLLGRKARSVAWVFEELWSMGLMWLVTGWK